jgi:ribose transport system ATP-binding protein
MIEIAKALMTDAEVIIMDEPTAALTEREIKKLFERH